MSRIIVALKSVEEQGIAWLKSHSLMFFRLSIGAIYFIFGVLKFFPNYSPAEQLAIDTIQLISFGLLSGLPALWLLAAMETIIGIGLISSFKIRPFVYAALGHMLCTFLPLALLPAYAFTDTSLSLIGQYIFKNLVIISGLLVYLAHHEG